MLEKLLCRLLGHKNVRVGDSAKYEWFRCSSCNESSRYRRPQPPEELPTFTKKTPSGHEYEMGVMHECGVEDCPANIELVR